MLVLCNVITMCLCSVMSSQCACALLCHHNVLVLCNVITMCLCSVLAYWLESTKQPFGARFFACELNINLPPSMVILDPTPHSITWTTGLYPQVIDGDRGFLLSRKRELPFGFSPSSQEGKKLPSGCGLWLL